MHNKKLLLTLSESMTSIICSFKCLVKRLHVISQAFFNSINSVSSLVARISLMELEMSTSWNFSSCKDDMKDSVSSDMNLSLAKWPTLLFFAPDLIQSTSFFRPALSLSACTKYSSTSNLLGFLGLERLCGCQNDGFLRDVRNPTFFSHTTQSSTVYWIRLQCLATHIQKATSVYIYMKSENTKFTCSDKVFPYTLSTFPAGTIIDSTSWSWLLKSLRYEIISKESIMSLPPNLHII